MAAEVLEALRLDKWLWAARFFKTRSLASDAINGGKVHLNGQRVKASKEVKVGNVLTINKNGYNWEITVLALSAQRRSAPEAGRLYQEDPESHVKRQAMIQTEKELKALLPHTGLDHRPNKKERRLIHRFKQMDS